MQRAASGATSLGRAATHAAAEVLQQDEHSAAWRSQRKHFFVLSNAGGCLTICPAPLLLCKSEAVMTETLRICTS